MNDPWADVRYINSNSAWFYEHTKCADGFEDYRLVVAKKDVDALVDRLLTDTDALLAVVPKLEFLAEIRGSFCIYPDKEIEHVGAAVVRKIAKKTLAALPEHLR